MRNCSIPVSAPASSPRPAASAPPPPRAPPPPPAEPPAPAAPAAAAAGRRRRRLRQRVRRRRGRRRPVHGELEDRLLAAAHGQVGRRLECQLVLVLRRVRRAHARRVEAHLELAEHVVLRRAELAQPPLVLVAHEEAERRVRQLAQRDAVEAEALAPQRAEVLRHRLGPLRRPLPKLQPDVRVGGRLLVEELQVGRRQVRRRADPHVQRPALALELEGRRRCRAAGSRAAPAADAGCAIATGRGWPTGTGGRPRCAKRGLDARYAMAAERAPDAVEVRWRNRKSLVQKLRGPPRELQSARRSQIAPARPICGARCDVRRRNTRLVLPRSHLPLHRRRIRRPLVGRRLLHHADAVTLITA